MGMIDDGLSYWQAETKGIDLLEMRIGDLLDRRADEVKLINPATGDIVPIGERGECCCRGYQVMAGYYKILQMCGNSNMCSAIMLSLRPTSRLLSVCLELPVSTWQIPLDLSSAQAFGGRAQAYR